ncbi:response regulator [Candidatus Poribacteria bacterium]|nr:response regulator [Candidatus Poribacteria bacterium]
MDANRVKLLLVDDDEDDYIVTRDLLAEIEATRYHLEWASSYESALEAVGRNQHDVYLFDYRLGRHNGLDLLREAIARGSKAPMILLTGQGDREIDVEAMKAGAADYLVKGRIDSRLLERSIRYALERAKSLEALRKSEEKYRTLFEESKDVVFVSSPEGHFMEINPAGVDLFGYSSQEELLRIDLARGLYMCAEDRSKFQDQITAEGFVKDYEFVAKTKDGRPLNLIMSATVVRDETGDVAAYRGIIRDITEWRKLEEQLLKAQKMESIGTLAGGIAHDFNNLLGGILGYISLIKTKVAKDSDLLDYLDTIEKSGQRAAELTAQLLAFARGGKYNVRCIPVDSLIEATLNEIGNTFGESIKIETRLAESLPTIEADAGQIQKALMNICRNARDAMPNGGKIFIESGTTVLGEDYVRTHPETKAGYYVTLSVTDTGIGMDKQTIKRIFDPFFTTKAVGKGTGLGLAMVYGIVKNHGGDIYVYSEPGHGSTFRIYLPSREMIEPARLEETENQPKGAANALILIVDDEPGIRSVLKSMLESSSYRVLVAEDGETAVETYKTHREEINLVILDMIMPKMEGRETFLKLREIDPSVKAILSTGYSQNDKTEEILRDGVTGFIQKPFQLKELISKVESVLDGQKQA